MIRTPRRLSTTPLGVGAAVRPAAHGDVRPGRWALWGALCGALVALLLLAPARWLAQAVAWGSADQVRLANPQGTVWSGSARVELRGGSGSTDAVALPERVNWRLRPAWDGVVAHLHADCCTPQPLQVHVQPRWGGARVRVADGASHWPAALLSGLGTPWNTLQPEGRLRLSTQALGLEWVQGRLRMHGQAQLLAEQVSSRLSTLRPMGSYRFTIQGGADPLGAPGAASGAEQPTTLNLTTLEGSLRLSGSGQWTAARLRFAGEASAEPGREAALANLLNIIGRRDGARSIITIG